MTGAATSVDDRLAERATAAETIALAAGRLAAGYFRSPALKRESKGRQDFVSEADRAVERLIRTEIAGRFPDDGLLGEEEDRHWGRSGITWVFDPIDGTASFLSGIAAWTVSVAVVGADRVLAGVVHDPMAGETFVAVRGGGASLNGHRLPPLSRRRLDQGSVGIGFAFRSGVPAFAEVVAALLQAGGMFYRNGSGASMLAQVAAGRLIGYYEPHMNAWDCLAGLLLVEEAGGRVRDYSVTEMLEAGGEVLCGAPGVFEEMHRMIPSS